MIPRTALVQLGKLVAQDLAHGSVSDALYSVGNTLATDPRALLTLLDLTAKEGTKKKPDDHLITAYALLLGQGLEVLRYGVERAHPQAIDSVTAISARMRSLAQTGGVEPGIIVLLLRQFVSAHLELDAGLMTIMTEMMEQQPPPSDSPGDIDDFLADLAAHCDGDIFALYGQLAEQAATFPETHRAGMAAALLGATDPSLREAAIGWLLDSGATPRHDTAGLLEQAGASGVISGIMLRRMIALRNWLPEAERASLDATVKACRLNGVECTPLTATTIGAIVASGIDGAGAQSLFIQVKEGRKYAVASLLLKQGVGVRDAWVRHGMTKTQAEGMLDQIEFQIEVFDSSMDYLRQALGHALSVNAQSGVLPPFGLIDSLETLGLATANPEPLPSEVLLERLISDIPARARGTASVKRALKASARWPEQYGFTQSWFEDGGPLDTVLDGKRVSLQRRHDLVLNEYLPPLRGRWAEMLGWTALMLRSDPEADSGWLDFTLVAREVASDRPLADIPVMTMIAATTVEAWLARKG